MFQFSRKKYLIIVLGLILLLVVIFLGWKFLKLGKIGQETAQDFSSTTAGNQETYRVFVEATPPKNLNNLTDEQNKKYNLTGKEVDSDSDGLSDKMEIQFGTDPKKKDTDGDGYTDAQEVLSGYNPLGPGKLKK